MTRDGEQGETGMGDGQASLGPARSQADLR